MRKVVKTKKTVSLWRAGCAAATRYGSRPVILLAALLCAALVAGCRMDMQDQPKYEAYEPSKFFENGQASRPLVEGTVPRGYLRDDPHLYMGKTGAAQTQRAGQSGTTQSGAGANTGSTATTAQAPSAATVRGNTQAGAQAANQGAGQTTYDPSLVTTFPFPVTIQVLNRGQERYEIYCAMCHGATGQGDGMIVRRGFRRPPAYTSPQLLEAPVGHFFDVITNGWGAMPSYNYMIPVEDRWAIIAYIRALQLSQNATVNDVPPEERAKLGTGGEGR